MRMAPLFKFYHSYGSSYSDGVDMFSNLCKDDEFSDTVQVSESASWV